MCFSRSRSENGRKKNYIFISETKAFDNRNNKKVITIVLEVIQLREENEIVCVYQ